MLDDVPFRARYRTEVLGRVLVRTCSVKSLRRWAEKVEDLCRENRLTPHSPY